MPKNGNKSQTLVINSKNCQALRASPPDSLASAPRLGSMARQVQNPILSLNISG